jgi:ribonuclease HI
VAQACIYLSETDEGHSYTFDGHQSVLMAELVAILKAVTHKASTGEAERTIFTDSLNSLHDLNKMIHSPRTMRTHKYRDILSFILRKATHKRDADNQPMQVHIYKVKAHANISGNEKADAYAKAAYLEGNSQVEHVRWFRHQTTSGEQWLYNAARTDPLTTSEACTMIDACVLQGAIQRVPYIKLWAAKDDAQNNIIDQKASCGFWKSSTAHKTRKRVLQCKAGTLLTQHQKYRFKI